MFFESEKHEVYTKNKHKIALNRDDYKRCVQAHGTTRLARGYPTLYNHDRLLTAVTLFIEIFRKIFL